jgi:hypothetical protein
MRQVLSIFSLALFSGLSNAATLETPSFVVRIDTQCIEGDLICNNVSYHGISKKRGASITLRGKKVYTMCADRITPCRFIGYEFINGDVRYFVSETGNLSVTRGKKSLVSEKGNWKY